MTEKTITLNSHEIYMAACIGVARRLASLKRGQTNKVQNKDFGWHTDIEGACAELALAKALNVFWDGSINTFKNPDVCNIQVRHTQIENGSLIFRAGDDVDSVFVLVVGSHPIFKIMGWKVGRDMVSDRFIRDPGSKFPAWFFPSGLLNDIDELDFGDRNVAA